MTDRFPSMSPPALSPPDARAIRPWATRGSAPRMFLEAFPAIITAMTPNEVEAIVGGYYSDPFRILGPHQVDAGWEIRAYLPQAAEVVSVVGDFNDWDAHRHPMRLRTGGIWELFIPEIGEGTCYKYSIRSRFLGYHQQKADPYGFQSEVPPKSASVVCDLSRYTW